LLLRSGLAGFGAGLFATLGLTFGTGLLLGPGLPGAGLLATLGLTFGTGLLLGPGLAGFGLLGSLCLALGPGLLLRTRLARVGSRLFGSIRRISGLASAFRRFGGRGLRLLRGLAATRFALCRLTGFSLSGFCSLALGLRSRFRFGSLL
jgi:hypothetical protein